MTGSCWSKGWKPSWKRWSVSLAVSRVCSCPEDFRASVGGIDRMDAICMILIAAGEEFKKIDRQTEGKLFSRYPFDWRGAIGVRDVMAHGYFDVDTEELFNICRDDVPSLLETLRTMIKDIECGTA